MVNSYFLTYLFLLPESEISKLQCLTQGLSISFIYMVGVGVSGGGWELCLGKLLLLLLVGG